MKYIKTAFLLSLFNFMIVGSIVLAFYKPETVQIPVAVINNPTTVVTPPEKVKLNNEVVPRVETQMVTPVVPTKAPPVVDNRCIIVVDSIQYDVTSFRNLHSGGDIFQCGTDMSSIFHGQHDNSFIGKMSQYKI